MILVILGVIYIGRVASIVTVPFLLAVTVAYLFEPVVAWLGRAGVRRRFASVLLIGASFLIVVVPAGVGLTVGVSQGVQLVERVAQRTGDVISSVEAPDDEGKREALGGVWLDVRDAVVELQQDEDRGELAERASFALQWARDNAEEITTRVASVGVSAIDVAAGFVGGLAKVVFTLFLTAFFYYFVCNGWGTLIATRDRFIPKDYRDEVDTLLHKFDRVISGFVRGRLTIALIQAVLFTIGYWLIGVPVPMLIGPAVAVLSIVPYLAVVGIPVSIILLYIEPNGGGWMDSIWWTVLAPTVLYNLGQWLDDYVWTPTIQGKEVGLGTATILFATFAGGAIMGHEELLRRPGKVDGGFLRAGLEVEHHELMTGLVVEVAALLPRDGPELAPRHDVVVMTLGQLDELRGRLGAGDFYPTNPALVRDEHRPVLGDGDTAMVAACTEVDETMPAGAHVLHEEALGRVMALRRAADEHRHHVATIGHHLLDAIVLREGVQGSRA
ncbi:MAG: AI-2E family transporter, partial [Myxococcota bacterium]